MPPKPSALSPKSQNGSNKINKLVSSQTSSSTVPISSKLTLSSSGSSSESDSDSESDSSSDSETDSDDESVSSEYMAQLLAAAKKNLSAKALGKRKDIGPGDDSPAEVMMLLKDDVEEDKPMPALDPGPSLPKPYLRLSRRDDRQAPASLVNDPDVERVSKLAATTSIASTLPAAPELSKKTGQPLTKAEKKALKDATAGPGWFDLPAPPASELPRLAREVEALRLRNSLDPKRFYRKEDTRAGPLPKHFALGHIVAEGGAFEGGGGGRGRDDLPRAARKRTIVDELMADDEARTYAKRKFAELQSVRDERGRGTYRRKFAKRQKKF